MNPKQDPPAPADPEPEADAARVGHTEHGIPPEALEEEPTGYPSSDRHHSEPTPKKD